MNQGLLCRTKRHRAYSVLGEFCTLDVHKIRTMDPVQGLSFIIQDTQSIAVRLSDKRCWCLGGLLANLGFSKSFPG